MNTPSANPELRMSAWVQTLHEALCMKPQVLVTGNVHDVYSLTGHDNFNLTLTDLIGLLLKRRGYTGIALVDPVLGLSPWRIPAVCTGNPATDPQNVAWNAACSAQITDTFGQRAGAEGPVRPGEFSANAVSRYVRAIATGRNVLQDGADAAATPLALIVVDADSFVGPITSPDGPAIDLFQFAVRIASRTEAFVRPGLPSYNPIVWLASFDKPVSEAQQQFMQIFEGYADYVTRRHIHRPSAVERDACSKWAFKRNPVAAQALAAQLEGDTLNSLFGVAQLAAEIQLPLVDATSVAEAIRRYRYGVLDNPWQSATARDKLNTLVKALDTQVIGQASACAAVVERLKRAVVGFSGAHRGRRSTRGPRAQMFLAGPTGVGKTETVRAVAESLFGSTEALIRFDMSEFRGEHADQRLMGAPPGYIGHDKGGELTDAVRARPFSVLLFDEIEKASPLIWDKFLQILEDGRLTDGHGVTTDFSQCVLFFTTNEGMSSKSIGQDQSAQAIPAVTADMSPIDMRDTVASNIRNYFSSRLNRPEVLNRIGENIIVYNFIDRKNGAKILTRMLTAVIDRTAELYNCTLSVSDTARSWLNDQVLAPQNLSQDGGRGIGNRIELLLSNPLATWLWPQLDHVPKSVTVDIGHSPSGDTELVFR